MKSARLIGIVVVLCVGLAYFSLPCACVTLVEIADDAIADQTRRALNAQQAFFEQHGRYARTVDELEYEPGAAVELQFEAVSDSSIVLRSTFLMMPEATCSLVVRPDITSLDGLTCSRH